ncbi:MAG TPA: hypothetical protein VGZ52_05525 [Acidimicrobiales bacterium]|jgi:hypothetical protein|nr:hypothetical protein [Acidimicrobiales bacterium]
MSRFFPRRLVAVPAIALLAMLGVVGCGSDNKATSTSSSSSAPPQPVSLTVTASEPSAGNFAFDVPTTIDGGTVQIALKNAGTQAHELQLVRVTDGTTPQQFEKDVLEQQGAPIPNYLLGPGGGAGQTAAGATTTVTEKLDPGTYIYFCGLGDTGKEHYRTGQLGSVTVQGSKGQGDLPAAAASVKAREYAFDISGLKAGSNTVRYENTGGQLHQAVFFPINPGATLDQVKAALSNNDPNAPPPPVDIAHLTSLEVLTPGGAEVQDNLTLQTGTYAVACFLSDKAGGPPHFLKGMIQELVVP